MHTHTRCDAEALPGPPTCCLQPACLSSCSTSLLRAWIPVASPRRWHPVLAALWVGDPLPLPPSCLVAVLRPPRARSRARCLPLSHPEQSLQGAVAASCQPCSGHRATGLAPREELLGSHNQIPYPVWGSQHWALPLQHIPLHRTPNRCQRVKVL